jgi:hypothetical protein
MKRDGKREGFEDDGQEMMMNTICEQNIIKHKSNKQNMNA